MILDLFAGMGGWSQGLTELDRADIVGVEIASHACATRRAAGHLTVEADVRGVDLYDYRDVEGICASPPCQTFSMAGRGQGRSAIGHLRSVLLFDAPIHDAALDDRTALVIEPLRWCEQLQPRWFALEQVPLVAPVWEAIARRLARNGWRVWQDVIDAACYGVPQHRRRACLLAARDRRVQRPPPVGAAPKSMAAALDWPTVPLDRRHDQSGSGETDPSWPMRRPATTIASRLFAPDPGSNANRFNGRHKSRNDGYRLTLGEALTLQGFPADYPVAGPASARALQVGNAIPPPLAAALLAQVL